MTAKRVLLWVGGAITGLIALLVIAVLALDTGPGKRLLLGQLAGFTTASGLNYRAGAIDGSIYGRMTIRNLEIRDLDGVLVTAPSVLVDWRPSALFDGGRIALAEASADTVRLLRRPNLNPSDPNDPLLPDLDIDIDRLRIDHFRIDPAVTGRRHDVGLTGAVSIADGRATVTIDANARQAAGIAGGDTLVLRLDAVPADNRLQLDARLAAPVAGLVDGFTNLGRPLAARISGEGSWASWRGTLAATSGTAPLADVALTAADGTFTAKGRASPGTLLAGPAQSLRRQLDLDITARLADRRVDAVAASAADAFIIAAKGRASPGTLLAGPAQSLLR
ncbi:hypothetical protein [Polymorphobacter fuscus]|uniref:hypothetical protein n=1 Tax=Sandarakinorhabdus fusca TaxID=1439888 RepID=UPI001FB0B0E3|nr:hypothetical protein [Polymorphobacter fuscus]